MVGDRLYTDIETGLRHGMTSILVMTGETTDDMLKVSETLELIPEGDTAALTLTLPCDSLTLVQF